VAKATAGRLVIDDLTGGRNGQDPPWAIKDNQCADAVNVEFYKSRLGTRRGGTEVVITESVSAKRWVGLFRHVPGIDDTAAELWGVQSTTNIIRRIAAGSTWATPTIKDALTTTPEAATAASINGKFFIAYGSATARMHCWDGSTIRRTGLAATGAPTAADGGGGGAYAAVLRYYRQRSTRQSGGITLGRSEPSASVAFTPSGANLNATVTQATVINEGETHWEVEASIDNVTFYRIATVVIGTTTYADSAATTTYNTNPLSAATGFYTLQKPYRFVAADQNRLLGMGSYTATDKQSRIEISAVIGSSDVSDEERVDTTTNYFIDLDEADSGVPTGLAGPIDGNFFAFKEKQIWQLVPTGNVSQPYRADAISKTVGAMNQASICKGEDRDGRPALYFVSSRGPYRWGANGLEYLGYGVEDFITGPNGTLQLGEYSVSSRVVYYQAKRQVIYFWASAVASRSDAYRYDVTHDAWSRDPGSQAGRYPSITSAVLFSNTLGASMSLDLKPYYGGADFTQNLSQLLKGDTGTQDQGTNFSPSVTTKAYEVGGPATQGYVSDAQLLSVAAAGVTIRCTVTPDFGLATGKSDTALLTASASETRVLNRMEDLTLSGFQFYQWTLDEAAAQTTAWNHDRLVVKIAPHESNI
jgi:hypothetical protein